MGLDLGDRRLTLPVGLNSGLGESGNRTASAAGSGEELGLEARAEGGAGDGHANSAGERRSLGIEDV